MARIHSFVAAGVAALALAVGALAAGPGETSPAASDRARAIAALERLGGRMAFDQLGHLRQLDLDGTKLTDADLRHVQGFTGLQELNLARTQVTDAGLKWLRGLTE